MKEKLKSKTHWWKVSKRKRGFERSCDFFNKANRNYDKDVSASLWSNARRKKRNVIVDDVKKVKEVEKEKDKKVEGPLVVELEHSNGIEGQRKN